MDTGAQKSTHNASLYLLDEAYPKEELAEFLRSQLIECGWRDQVAAMCRNYIQKHGVENVKLSDIINEVRFEARQKVPEKVRNEVLGKLRKMTRHQRTPE